MPGIFVFILSSHQSFDIWGKDQDSPKVQNVPESVNSIYKGFGEDGLGSKGHAKEKSNVCEGVEERM